MTSLTIAAPPSKSISHRVLIAAALASGDSQVEGILESRDLTQTADILRAAGADIRREAKGRYVVRGVAGKPRGGTDTPLSCDVHESGTTCRLLTAVLAAGEGLFRVHGAPRIHERPLGDLAEALRELGAVLRFEQREGCPPVVLEAKGLHAPREGVCRISLEQSSQYLSGLLLAAPLAREPVTLEIGGQSVVSWPYAALTLQTLEDFGVPFQVEERSGASWLPADWRSLHAVEPGRVRFRMQPAPYRAGRHAAEGDWSSASYFLAAGAVGRRPVRVEGLRRNSLQGDRAMLDILIRMGAKVETEAEAVTVFPSPLHGVSVDMGSCPDLVPTVAVLAAFAEGETLVRNVAHLRLKESDRLAAPAEELARLGVRTAIGADSLAVTGLGQPPQVSSCLFSSHGDHRIAMSLALLELHGQRVGMDDPGCVSKSFPDFWDLWEGLRQA